MSLTILSVEDSLGLPCYRHDLTYAKIASSDDRAVHAGVIIVHTNYGFHDFRISLGCVRVEVDHDTSFIPHRDFHCGRVVPFTKDQRLAHPFVFLKRLGVSCFDDQRLIEICGGQRLGPIRARQN